MAGRTHAPPTTMERKANEYARQTEVPEVVVLRLPLYLRALSQMAQQDLTVVSSQALGDKLRITPAQIRKDLSYFGRFGKQGRGYSVHGLTQELRQILGLDRDWDVALVGVGRLGRAILSYPGLRPEGFRIVAAFDTDPRCVGETINGVLVRPDADLPRVVAEQQIPIAIVAVPAAQTQTVVDLLVASGIRAILNYTPYSPAVPPGVRVSHIDPVLSLQSMTFYLHGAAQAVP